MKIENLNKIKSLLDKYELGQTSLEEENVLIAYFKLEEIPHELVKYQAEFNYYATFKTIQFTGSLNEVINTSESSILKKISQFFSKWYVISIIISIPVLIFILTQHSRQTKEVKNKNYQAHEKGSALLNMDSTLAEKITTQLDTTVEIEHSNQAPISEVPLLKKDTVIADRLPLQKKDSVKISTPKTNKIPVMDSTSNENNSLNKIQNPSKNNLNDSSLALEKVMFNITEKSTSGELASISRRAKKAGIEYTYIVDTHKKKIHELNIVMIIRSTGDRSQLWISYPKKSSFLETICWTANENGQAVSLCHSKVEHKVKAKHPIE